jgi:hypothetical protein
MMALYLSMMLSIESVTDLPPLPPPSLTDRLVLLTTIQLGKGSLGDATSSLGDAG